MLREEFANLIGAAAVIVVVAYILMRTQIYADVTGKRSSWRQRAGIVLLFGLFSIYGTTRGVRILDAVVNIRDLGPVIAGLIAGPFVGLATGLIGGIHRYLQGGFTALSCSLSTLLAGLIAGLYCLWKGGIFPGVKEAMLFIVVIECFHQGLTLLIARPFPNALRLVETSAIPMIAASAIGIGLFAFMVENLKREKEMVSAKHVIEGELKAARDIQMRMLPQKFPPFPQRTEFDIFAIIRPAREVGGDFYDFFFIDENRLCFVIGDVSGKGVPASLFMALAKTFIKTGALRGFGPAEVLSRVNDELSRDNDASMFVTVFCATLDARTGEIVYSNGGHNPPYMLTTDGRVVSLSNGACPIVGAIAGISYGCTRVRLGPGDTIFLFTDGVPEAVSKEKAFFTTGRLESSLSSAADLSVRDTVGKVATELGTFCEGAEQFDDITMMAVRFKGSTTR